MTEEAMQHQQTKYQELYYAETADEERERLLRLKNKRNAVSIFQASWILAFVCLAVVNLQLRTSSPEWPPLGVEKLNPVLPTIATLGLLASIPLVRRGVRSISADGTTAFLVQWRAALVLGLAFVGIMAFEWITVPPLPMTEVTLANRQTVVTALSQYNAIFRVMTAFHMVHALAIGGYMINVWRSARRGELSSADYWPAEAGAKLWYFVVIAWMLFYVVLYWL
jgi:heme/copper-type cytochrome/quinol oxidase subunit 3